MYSTGVEALDSRLGGVARGHFLLVLGPPSVGKSVLGTHFLVAGLDRRERCVLVTSDSPSEIDARGLYVGFSPGALSQHPSLDRTDGFGPANELGASHRHPPVEALQRVVRRGTAAVSRLVIDDLNSLLRSSHAPEATATALVQYLQQLGTTACVIVSTADAYALDDTVLDVFQEAADAVIGLEQSGRGRRRLVFRNVRQASFSTDPFLYTLRSGGGFTEDLPAFDRQVDPSLRKRVVILDEVGALPAEVAEELAATFEVETFTDLNGSLSRLLEARHGTLILGTDPYDPDRMFNLAYSLRRAGNGAPILFVSPSKGLRSMTRARALRIGGDDFLIAELPPQQLVERITRASQRGHRRRQGRPGPERPLQPKHEDGTPRPMTTAELTSAIAKLSSETPTPFFALAVLEPEAGLPAEEMWQAVRGRIRLEDGDFVAILEDGRLAMVLNQVDLSLSRRVLARLRRAHPALATSVRTTVLTSPLQGDELRSWIAEVEFGRGVRA